MIILEEFNGHIFEVTKRGIWSSVTDSEGIPYQVQIRKDKIPADQRSLIAIGFPIRFTIYKETAHSRKAKYSIKITHPGYWTQEDLDRAKKKTKEYLALFASAETLDEKEK
jgi:hypothetical protein